MLYLPSGVGVPWFGPEPLHPSVADAVEEDDETFNKLGSGDVLPASDGDPVPRPTEFREGAQKAGEGDKSIAPEDSTFDEMCKTDIDVIPSAPTGVDDNAGKQLDETNKDESPFQRGKKCGADLLVPRFFAA